MNRIDTIIQLQNYQQEIATLQWNEIFSRLERLCDIIHNIEIKIEEQKFKIEQKDMEIARKNRELVNKNTEIEILQVQKRILKTKLEIEKITSRIIK